MRSLRRACSELTSRAHLFSERVLPADTRGSAHMMRLGTWTHVPGSNHPVAGRSKPFCGQGSTVTKFQSGVHSPRRQPKAPHFFERLFATGSSGTGGGGGAAKSLGGGGGGGDGGFSGWVAGLWAAYLQQLDTRPVFTKMWTSGLLNGVGDTLCQSFFEGDAPFDFKRLCVFTSLGLFLVGPTLHYWYTALSKFFSTPGTRAVLGSVTVDQLLFAPTFCGVFLSTLMILEGQMMTIPAKLKQDWFNTVVMNWKIWVPAQLINFWLVPPNLRVLCANITAVVWNVYLSFASHIAVEEEG